MAQVMQQAETERTRKFWFLSIELTIDATCAGTALGNSPRSLVREFGPLTGLPIEPIELPLFLFLAWLRISETLPEHRPDEGGSRRVTTRVVFALTIKDVRSASDHPLWIDTNLVGRLQEP